MNINLNQSYLVFCPDASCSYGLDLSLFVITKVQLNNIPAVYS